MSEDRVPVLKASDHEDMGQIERHILLISYFMNRTEGFGFTEGFREGAALTWYARWITREMPDE